MRTKLRPRLANFVIALAAGAAMLAYADAVVDPGSAAESHFLAVWATLVLVAMAGIAVMPAIDLAVTAVLTTLAVWAIPHGPTRGAAVGFVLVVALAVTALRHLDKSDNRLTWTWAVASALGLQLLCRADRLLQIELEPRLIIGVLLLPIGAALALLLYDRKFGPLPALIAVGTAALLVPGWSVTVVLSLLSLGLGLLWRNAVLSKWLVSVLALALFVAAYSWQPALCWLVILAFLSLHRRATLFTGLVALTTTAVLTFVVPAARPWNEVLGLLALGPLLVPAALVPANRRPFNILQGLVLGALALRIVAGPGALAAPLVIAALSMRSGGVISRLQLLWTGVLLVGVTLLAGYPWMRQEPLVDLLSVFGLGATWTSAIAVALGVWILSLLCAWVSQNFPRVPCSAPLNGLVLLGLLAFFHLPASPVRPFGDHASVLTRERLSVGTDLSIPSSTSSVVVDSYLDNAAELEPGTPVARVILVHKDGERRSWLLRAGFETGEWAARRPDVAALPGFQAPPPWLSWVTSDGRWFAQRYRAVWQVGETLAVNKIEIERLVDLPDNTSIAVLHLELRP